METQESTGTRKLGGYAALLGSACAVAGAALMQLSGADLDRALAAGEMAEYLVTAKAHSGMIVTNLTLWILMVLLLGIAATAMSRLGVRRPLMAQVARYSYWVGSPLVIAAYVAWIAIVVQIAPDTSPAALLIARTLGWFASRADWVATILIVGVGPTLLAIAGREDWVPAWLFRWSLLTAAAGVLTLIAMLTGGSGLGSYGFVIIPVGVFWMVAAGVVLLRSGGRAA